MSTKHEHKSVFTADNKDFNRKTEQVESRSQKLKKALLGMAGAMAAAFSVQKVIQWGKEAAKAFDKQAKAEQSLLVALKGREDIQQKLIQQAQDLQKETLFGDEETIKAQALAASMGLTYDQISKLIPAAQNLAVATGNTLDFGVKNLARTYAGLSGELGEVIPALRELTQEEMAAGKAIDLVNDLMGGQAKAAAEVGLGSVKQLSNAWGDMQERIGKRFILIISRAANALKGLVVNIGAGEKALKREKNAIAAAALEATGYAEGTEEREKALEKLQTIYPEYFGNLDAEKSTNEDILSVLKKVNEQYEQKLMMLEYGKELSKIAKQEGRLHAQRIKNVKLLQSFQEEYNYSQDLSLEELIDKTQNFIEHQKKIGKPWDGYLKGLQEAVKSLSSFDDNIAKIGEEKEEIEAARKALRDLLTTTEDTSKEVEKQIITIGTLNEQLKEQQAELENIDISNREAIDAKIADIKATEQQIAAIQDYIDKLTEAKKAIERVAVPDKIQGKTSVDLGTEAVDTSELEGMKEQVITVDELKNKIMELSEGMGIYAQAHIASVMATAESTDQLAAGLEKITDLYLNLTDAAGLFADEIMAASASGIDNMEDFAKTAANTAKKIIAAYLAEAVAGQVKAWAGTGPFGLIAAGIAAAGTVTLFNSVVPSFAEGGAVTGPTLAMVGEAAGISSSNPEYIGTARQLAQMGAGRGGGQLTARISKGDLLFILNEGEKYNNNSF